MSTITITYACKSCWLIEQELSVPQRQRAVHPELWMKVTVKYAAVDHDRRRPECHWKKIELQIPGCLHKETFGRSE